MVPGYYLLDRVPTVLVLRSTIDTVPVKLYGSFGSVVTSETGCWTWNGTPSGDYGTVRYRGDLQLVHRLAYWCAIGPIPDGLEIDHKCRNTKCWNPEHLEPVTGSENRLRGTYHTDDKQEKEKLVKSMPPDAWVVCASLRGEFKAAEFHRLVTVLPGRDDAAIQTTHRWLRQDPRVTKVRYSAYTVELPEN